MFDRYRRRMTTCGETLREKNINFEKYQINQLAPNNPNYKQVTIEDVTRNLMIVNTQQITAKTIYAMPDEDFDVGQIVLWNGSHWLITQRDLDNDIITRGYMQQCNRQIIWQNPQTRKIFALWATVEKPYYSNLDASQKIEVSTREFRVQIPYTDESKLIDIDKRFMLEIIGGEPKTYRVTAVDSMTQRYDRDGEITGFIILNLEQCLYNPLTDNVELEVCDYLPPVENNDIISETVEITYRGKPVIRAGGSKKSFTGVINNVTEIGNWELKSDNLTGIHHIIDGNKISISADNDMRLVGKLLSLTYKSSSSSAFATIEIEVVN